MTIAPFVESCAFGPEAITAMTEALDAACNELHDTGQPEVAREVMAQRIIITAAFGERDPVRLQKAALRGWSADAS